jgi:hypothetical protein
MSAHGTSAQSTSVWLSSDSYAAALMLQHIVAFNFNIRVGNNKEARSGAHLGLVLRCCSVVRLGGRAVRQMMDMWGYGRVIMQKKGKKLSRNDGRGETSHLTPNVVAQDLKKIPCGQT